jgi:hypothetical protein
MAMDVPRDGDEVDITECRRDFRMSVHPGIVSRIKRKIRRRGRANGRAQCRAELAAWETERESSLDKG